MNLVSSSLSLWDIPAGDVSVVNDFRIAQLEF
jgi:hypothetical protein